MSAGVKDGERGSARRVTRGGVRPGRVPGSLALATLGAGLLLGLAADALFWHQPLGPGLPLWIGLLGAAAVLLARRRGWTWARSAAVWSAVAVVAAAGTAWRAPGPLQPLFLGVIVVSASAVLLEARGRPLLRTRAADQVLGLVLVPWSALVGGLLLLTRASLPERRPGHRALAVGRGVLLAIPPVVVFASLFAAADPAFARAIGRLVPDLELLPKHLFLIGFFGWVGAGLLAGTFPGQRRNPLAVRPPRVGVEEVATVLGLVGVVFLGYVALQAGYLFGGTATVEAVSGLTLAEYARRGFFELLAAAGLVLALLLLAHAAAPRQGAGRRAYRALGAVLVLLVMVVIASAALRLRLYIAEFGLTQARLYAAAVMLWLAVTLGLFAATVLRGRPRPFAGSAVLAGIAVVFGLAVLNPDARIARVNLGLDSRDVDAEHLVQLSADAAPVVLDRLATLDPADRCTIASRYLRRWGPDVQPEGDWRSWNAGTARARSAVQTALPDLRAAARQCP